jgi:NADH:ubiquinone oxidoreductase subunit 3 (subunit A)
VVPPRPAVGPSDNSADIELTPEEQAAWHAGVERVEQEKREALRAPGPSWREWFFYDHARWWVGLLFLIVDVWVFSAWAYGGDFAALNVVGLTLSLAVAVYLEFLTWGYLWRRPSETSERRYGRFRPSWRALREFGRWTPEGAGLQDRSDLPTPEDGSPNPREFL